MSEQQKSIAVWACCGIFGRDVPWEAWYVKHRIERTFRTPFDDRQLKFSDAKTLNIDFAIDPNSLTVDWDAVVQRIIEICT